MEIIVKRLLPEAVMPKRANKTDAGVDLVATSKRIEGDLFIEYGTGIAVEIPKGYVGLLFPRSSVTNKQMMLKNSVGVIDSEYRGEIKARFMFRDENEEHYSVGERVAQLLIVPIALPDFIESEVLNESDRGEGGFGSTGK
jgi:dUTP pyrophosphatase